MAAVEAEGLVKVYGSRKNEVRALDGVDLDGRGRHRARPARPERRGQDDDRPHPRHAAAAGRRPRDGRGLRRRPRRAVGARGDRPLRAVRGGRREPDRAREPLDVRPALPARPAPRRAAGPTSCSSGSTSRTPPAPGREDLLRRHAPAARPRRGADRPPAAAVPRRADDRPRPAQPARRCGTSSATQVREGATLLLTTQYLEEADELADEIAVVDTGRIIARGTADELKSQVGGERIEVVVHERADLGRGRPAAARARRAATIDEHDAADHDRRRRRRGAARRRRPAARRGRRSRSTTSGCAGRRSTTSSSRSPGTSARTLPDGRAARRRRVSASLRDAPRSPTAGSSTWRNLKRVPRIPELAVFAILQSIMFVLLFAFVFGGAIPLPGRRLLPRVPDAGDLRPDARLRLDHDRDRGSPTTCRRA